MDRKPATHGGVFSDEAFAREYARKHWKMAAGFGKTYGKKLKDAGFVQGRVLDVGCGLGASRPWIGLRGSKSGVCLEYRLSSLAFYRRLCRWMIC